MEKHSATAAPQACGAGTGVDVVAHLPLEVSVFIFSLLPLPDIGRAARVSKVWQEVATNDALWHVLFEQRYQQAPSHKAELTFMEAFLLARTRVAAGKRTGEERSRRALFQGRARLEDRWRRGQYQKTLFQAHPYAVNGVKFLTTDHAPLLPKPVAGALKDKKGKSKKDKATKASGEEAMPASSMVLLTWSDDCKIKLWQPYATTSASTPSIECSLELVGHQSLVFTADSDGEVIVSGGVDERLIIWSLNTGQALDEIRDVHQRGIERLQLHKHQVVTCGGSDATPKLWDIQTKQCTASFIGHKGRVFALAANFDEHLLVTAGSGSTFRCWDMRTHECVLMVTNKSDKLGHNMNEVLRLEERLLATGDSAGDVKLWDLRQLPQPETQDDFWLSPLTTYRHSDNNICSLWGDATKLVSVGSENVLKFWEFNKSSLSTSEHVPFFQLPAIPARSIQGDERALVCGARDGSVTILDFGADHDEPKRRAKKDCLLQ